MARPSSISTHERQELQIRLAAVTQCGDAIRFLAPEERQELQIRLAAVTQCAAAINHLNPSERQVWIRPPQAHTDFHLMDMFPLSTQFIHT